MIPYSCAVKLALLLFPVVAALQGQIWSQELISPDPQTRQSALRRLAALSPQQKAVVLPQLMDLLKAGKSIVPAFATIGPLALPALILVLNDPKPFTRGLAARAIATIRPADTVDLLRPLLKDPDVGVRERVAESLLSIGAEDALALAIIKAEVSVYMFSKGKPPAGDPTDWIRLLASDNATLANSAVSALRESGNTVIPLLITALASPDPNVRMRVARLLVYTLVYAPGLESAVIQALDDPNAAVHKSARRYLHYVVTPAAMNALLQDEINEKARKADAELFTRSEAVRPHSLDEVLAPIPSDANHKYPLELKSRIEATGRDGTQILVTIHSGKLRGDLLRIWRITEKQHHLIKSQESREAGDDFVANSFHNQGDSYLFILQAISGQAHDHVDEVFRIESGSLIKLMMPKGLPFEIGRDEELRNGWIVEFTDDDMRYEFSIYDRDDSRCCSNNGWIKGTYVIVGDELRYGSWTRLQERPR